MLKMTEFTKRRKELVKKINANGVVIISASPIIFRNHYHEFPYRQNSDFHYLTGFDEPEAVMLLTKNEFILFNRVRDREKEIWDGYRAGQKGACEIYGADQAFPISEFTKKLPELLQGREEIYFPIGIDANLDKYIMDALNTLRGKVRTGIETPAKFSDISPLLHEMRVIKSSAEIALMRKAAEISADGHIRAMQFCKPGMNEYQLAAEVTYEFQRQGAHHHAYTPIVGSGEHSCILHYISNNQPIKNGDMVLIDAGAEYHYYAADVTRTFPANGRFTAEQRAVYEVVLAAQLAGIQLTKPGTSWVLIEDTVTKVITQGLIDIGLLKGSLDSLIEQKAYFKFYMHRSGHFLGLDVHDAGSYKIENQWRKLEPGMVRTVEPGIYISADIPDIHPRWHNIGIRIEDDVLVTEKGNEIFSSKVTKNMDEIEQLMEK